MSDVVHVRHPAPVTYIPKGARRPRTTFVPLETPVRLVEADPSSFEHLRYVRQSIYSTAIPHYAHEGRLWLRIEDWGPFIIGGKDYTRDRLVREVLQGITPDTPLGALSPFERTPLLLGIPYRPGQGEPLDPGRVRSVVEDGTERARREVARFVEEEVRIVGGKVFVRARGPLLGVDIDGRVASLTVQVSPGHHAFREDRAMPFTSRLDRSGEFLDFCRAHFPGTVRLGWECQALLPNGLPSGLLADDDLRLLANELPQVVEWYLLEAGPLRTERGLADGTLRAGLEAMARWKPWGQIGAIPLEQAEDVASVALETVRAAREAYPAYKASFAANLLLDYVERVALPRLRDLRSVPDDTAALAGLGGP